MTTRLSIAAAASALAVLPLLAACGAASGQTGSSADASAPASSSTASSAPAPSSSSPAASATPTADTAQDKKEVMALSKKFGSAFVTFGYPDKSFDSYLKRLRPLTTDAGYAEATKESKDAKFEKISKQFSASHIRSVPVIKGDVKVVELAASTAETEVAFGARFEQQSGSGWKTLKTTPTEKGTLDLVKQDGHWLVDHLPGS